MNAKLVSILVLMLLFQYVESWKGHVCTRRIASWRTVKQCSYRSWFGSCHVVSVRVVYYRHVKVCCSGWTTSTYQNCDRAICLPACKNGRKCTSPGICTCSGSWKWSHCGYNKVLDRARELVKQEDKKLAG